MSGLGILDASTTDEAPKGFWGTIKRIARRLVVIVSERFVGSQIAGFLDDFFASQGWRIAETDTGTLSPLELDMLDRWELNYLSPFFVNICSKIDADIAGLKGLGNDFVLAANEVKMLMAIALSNSKTNFFNSINDSLAQAQHETLEAHFNAILAFIDKRLVELNIPNTVVPTQVIASNYIMLLESYPLRWNNETITTSYNRITTSNESTDTSDDVDSSPPRPTDTTTPTTTPKKSNTLLKALALLAIGFGISKAVAASKTANKKSK
jgi:hypothetical protein